MLSNISPAEAQKMLRDNKARLVDVREADELAAVRIAGGKSILIFTPANLSANLIASSLPFRTWRSLKASCSWLFIVLTALHFNEAISFFSYPDAYICAVTSHSCVSSVNTLSIIV